MDIKLVVCGLLGHSRIITAFFGYQYCGRCNEQLGDTLGGVGVRGYFPVHDNSDCPDCKTVKATLTWRDYLLVPRKVLQPN